MSDTQTVLLTLGRLPVALDIARAMHAAGCRVVVAEPWSRNLCSLSKVVAASYRTVAPREKPQQYRAQIDAIARYEQAALVIPVSEETLHVCRIPKPAGREMFAQGFADTLHLQDKLTFIRLAESFGLRTPKTVTSADRWPEDQAAVIKPRLACGGRGIRYPGTGAALDIKSDELLQQRVIGQELSILCLCRDGIVLSLSCYRSELRDGAVAVAFEATTNLSAEQWATDFVTRSRHTGFIAFDFIVDSNAVAWPLECNPRATSGIHLLPPASISAAILGHERAGHVEKTALRRMEFYSCLTLLVAAVIRRRDIRKTFAVLRTHKDITWSGRDPLPFLLMLPASWRIIWLAIRHRQSFAQAAVADLEWRRIHA